jgi:hypothetical protein
MAARERKAEAARILVFACADKRDRRLRPPTTLSKTKTPATISRRGRIPIRPGQGKLRSRNRSLP